LDRNIKTYYIRQFFHNLFFILPVIVIFYQGLGFTLTQIFLLQSIAAITTMITNIPAGLLADRIGRKRVLLVGIFLMSLFLFFYLFAVFYIEFFILDVLWGVSFSFITVEIPLVSDSLLAIGKEEKTTEVYSKGNTILILSLITSNVILVFLIPFGYRFTVLCTLFAIIASFFTALIGYKEPRVIKPIKSEKLMYHLKKMYKYCVNNNYLTFFIFIGSIFLSLSFIGFWLVQPYYKESYLPPESYGILFAVTNTVELISTNLSYRFEKKLGWKNTIFFVNIIFSIAFLGMSFIFSIFAIVFVILRQVGYAFSIPLFNSYINEEITVMESNESKDEPTSRATIYSVYGMITNLIYAILMPLIGFLIDNSSLSVSSFIIFICFVTLLLLNFIIIKRLKRNL